MLIHNEFRKLINLINKEKDVTTKERNDDRRHFYGSAEETTTGGI